MPSAKLLRSLIWCSSATHEVHPVCLAQIGLKLNHKCPDNQHNLEQAIGSFRQKEQTFNWAGQNQTPLYKNQSYGTHACLRGDSCFHCSLI